MKTKKKWFKELTLDIKKTPLTLDFGGSFHQPTQADASHSSQPNLFQRVRC